MLLPLDDDIRERVRARRYRAGQFRRELTGRVRQRASKGERFQKLAERYIAEAVVVLLRLGSKEPRQKVTMRVLVSRDAERAEYRRLRIISVELLKLDAISEVDYLFLEFR